MSNPKFKLAKKILTLAGKHDAWLFGNYVREVHVPLCGNSKYVEETKDLNFDLDFWFNKSGKGNAEYFIYNLQKSFNAVIIDNNKHFEYGFDKDKYKVHSYKIISDNVSLRVTIIIGDNHPATNFDVDQLTLKYMPMIDEYFSPEHCEIIGNQIIEKKVKILDLFAADKSYIHIYKNFILKGWKVYNVDSFPGLTSYLNNKLNVIKDLYLGEIVFFYNKDYTTKVKDTKVDNVKVEDAKIDNKIEDDLLIKIFEAGLESLNNKITNSPDELKQIYNLGTDEYRKQFKSFLSK